MGTLSGLVTTAANSGSVIEAPMNNSDAQSPDQATPGRTKNRRPT